MLRVRVGLVSKGVQDSIGTSVPDPVSRDLSSRTVCCQGVSGGEGFGRETEGGTRREDGGPSNDFTDTQRVVRHSGVLRSTYLYILSLTYFPKVEGKVGGRDSDLRTLCLGELKVGPLSVGQGRGLWVRPMTTSSSPDPTESWTAPLNPKGFPWALVGRDGGGPEPTVGCVRVSLGARSSRGVPETTSARVSRDIRSSGYLRRGPSQGRPVII